MCMVVHTTYSLKAEYDVKCRIIIDLEHKISVLTNESVIMGRRNGGTLLVHIGTNNADKEGTTAMVEKYRNQLP